MKKLNRLSEIYNSYDTFIIDLWGVMHDGVNLNKEALNVVDNLMKNNKRVVFLSNAPRPRESVIKFLRKLKMNEKYLKNVFTSGEAAIKSLKSKKFGKKFFHLGPARDSSLFKGLESKNSELKNCDFILCTGLFDNHETDLDYYKKLLQDSVTKKFICTNPDLIVHRGQNKEFCAGTIAEIFKSLGGKVIYFGKPYKAVYETILNDNEKSFAIGDNLNTDIKGANNLGLDSLFITNGIHRMEFKKEEDLNKLLKKYNVSTSFFQKNLHW